MFNLQVGIDGTGAVRGAKTVNNALDSMARNSRETNQSVGRIEKSIGGLGTAARNAQKLLVGLFAGAAARQITVYADAYTKLGNQIALVTENSTQASVIQNELFSIADRARAPIEEIGTLYGRAAISAQELGASQGDLLKFTEGVSQALAINGSSAQEAKGALLQLSQALGSGIVRAEEFNSILEGARPVLSAVADGMGITVAQLRTMTLEGEVTSREFFDAFQSQLGALDEKFKTTNATIGQAGTILNNAFVEAFGTMSELSGASNGVVKIFRGLADFVRGPLVDGFIALSVNTGQIITDFDNLFTAIKEVGSLFFDFVSDSIDDSEDYINAVGSNLMSPWQTLRTTIEIATVESVSFFDRLITGWQALNANFANDQEEAARLFAELRGKEEARLKTINGILAEREERERRIADAQRSARDKFTPEDRLNTLNALPKTGSASGGGGGPSGDTEADEKLAKEVAAFNEANNAAIKYQNTTAEILRLQAAGADETAVANALIAAAEDLNSAAVKKQEALREEVAAFNEANNAAIAYENVLKEIARLEAAGADPEAVKNAREAAEEEFRNSTQNLKFLQELGKSAAQDIQGAFRDLFLTAGEGLDDFADKFGETLQRISANFLANQAIKFLLNTAGDAFGGKVGGIFSSFAGEFDSGGRIPAGQFGIAGERGPEIVEGPATVTSRADTAAMMAPDVNLNIVNVSDPRAAVEAATNTNSGDKGVVNQIERNAADIRRVLGLA